MSNYYNQGPPGPPPHVPEPWIAEWDARDRRWIFINRANGERTFEYPNQYPGGYGQGYQNGENRGYGQGYQSGENRGYGQGYNQGYGQGYGSGVYQGERIEEARLGQQQQAQKHGHSGLAYGAMGAAAGLVGGALLMHEGEKVEDHWKRDEYRAEEKWDDAKQDVEYAPEEVAGWTGRKVGEVENIPQDVDYDYDRAKYGVENRFDNAVDDVEDVPDRVAYDVGQDVGDVERFDDRVDNSYDAGRYEGRNDGW